MKVFVVEHHWLTWEGEDAVEHVEGDVIGVCLTQERAYAMAKEALRAEELKVDDSSAAKGTYIFRNENPPDEPDTDAIGPFAFVQARLMEVQN